MWKVLLIWAYSVDKGKIVFFLHCWMYIGLVAYDKRPTTSYIFLLRLTPITWCSHKQQCVAISLMESKHMALSSCVREGVWLQRLLIELNLFKSTKPTIISCDNQNIIKLFDNRVFHTKTKHIEVHHHLYSGTSSKWCYEDHTCTSTRPHC
jgi:hypothetical protein